VTCAVSGKYDANEPTCCKFLFILSFDMSIVSY
jgi:hypothetical protein